MGHAHFSKKKPVQLYFLSLTALLGASLSAYLSQHFYQVRNGTAGFKSFCNIGQAMNCDLIAASPYAELLMGLPLSSFAGGWFLAQFIVSLFSYNAYWYRETLRAIFGFSVLGALASLFYLLIMITQLKTLCLLCLGIDVLTFTSLGLVLSLKPEAFSIHKLDLLKWKVFLFTTIIALLIAVLSLRTFDELSIKNSDIQELADSVLNTPALSVNVDEEFPSIGPKSAPITIVEFSDFQCPFCRIAAHSIHSILNRYPNQVRLIFRHFPLDQTCNPQVQQSAHPSACEASRVAHCSNKLGQFEPIYEELFSKQATFNSKSPFNIAVELGLNENDLRACYQSQEPILAISRDIREAVTLGIQSTPTLFINGHKMEGAYPVPAWIKIIDHLLKK